MNNVFDDLIKKLKNLPTGNTNSSEYEDLCFNIIDALFGQHFYGWDSKNLDSTKKKFFQLGIPNEEQSNNKPYQKRDLVVPIKEFNTLPDFWKFISRTLNAVMLRLSSKIIPPVLIKHKFTLQKNIYTQELYVQLQSFSHDMVLTKMDKLQ